MKEKKEHTEQTTELSRTEAQPFTPFTPLAIVSRFATDMERLFQDFEPFRFPSVLKREFLPLRTEFEHVTWVPEVEVLQKNGEFIVHVDLPGLKRNDLKAELTDNVLTISGERKEEKEEKRHGYTHSERSYGSFYRQIPLPEGAKAETATATFMNGVLEITVQAPEREARTRRLEITGEETAKAKAAAK
jgi:HSP20 family protein